MFAYFIVVIDSKYINAKMSKNNEPVATVTKAHCNECGGNRNHKILHSEETSYEEEEYHYWISDKYEMLKCLGCEQIRLRHTHTTAIDDCDEVTYFPPSIFRPIPKWLGGFWLFDEDFVETLLKEIYIALHNNLPSLAAMGVRSLVEKIMIAKTGDHGTFAKNISEFEKQGFVSRIEKERLETILEAGHAVIHRTFTPSIEDVVTLVDITEHIIATVYLQESEVKALKKKIPPREKKS
jgi:hypothetical protein